MRAEMHDDDARIFVAPCSEKEKVLRLSVACKMHAFSWQYVAKMKNSGAICRLQGARNFVAICCENEKMLRYL